MRRTAPLAPIQPGVDLVQPRSLRLDARNGLGYLDRHGLFYDVESGRVRASALHVICDMCGTEITLGMGRSIRAAPVRDPAPECWGLNPNLAEAEGFPVAVPL
jgi:hypothetical protein